MFPDREHMREACPSQQPPLQQGECRKLDQVLSPALQQERLDAFIGWQMTDAKEKGKRQQPAYMRVLHTESLEGPLAKAALTHTAQLLGLDRLSYAEVDMLAAQPGTPAAAAAAQARTQYGMGRGVAAGHSNMTAGKKTSHHKQTARKLPSQAQKTRQTARKATGTSVPASLAAAAGGAVPFTSEQQLQQALELLPASLPDDGLLERFTVPEDDPRAGLRGQEGVRIKATAGRVVPGTILSAYGNYCMPNSDNWALQQQAPGWLQEEYSGCHPAAARKAWELSLESYATEDQSLVYNDFPQPLVSFHGFGYGTLAGLSNDPNINTAGQQQQEEEGKMEEGARPDKQPLSGNAKVIYVWVFGWPFPLLMATNPIQPGQEVLYAYGGTYWVQHGILHQELQAWKEAADMKQQVAAQRQQVQQLQEQLAAQQKQVTQLRWWNGQLQGPAAQGEVATSSGTMREQTQAAAAAAGAAGSPANDMDEAGTQYYMNGQQSALVLTQQQLQLQQGNGRHMQQQQQQQEAWLPTASQALAPRRVQASADKQVVALQQQVRQLQGRLLQQEERHQLEVQRRQQEVEDLGGRVQQVLASAAPLQQEHEVVTQQLHQVQAAKQQLQAQLVSLRGQLQQQQQQVEEHEVVTQQLRQLQVEKHLLRGQLLGAQQAPASCRPQQQQQQQQVEGAPGEVAAIQQHPATVPQLLPGSQDVLQGLGEAVQELQQLHSDRGQALGLTASAGGALGAATGTAGAREAAGGVQQAQVPLHCPPQHQQRQQHHQQQPTQEACQLSQQQREQQEGQLESIVDACASQRQGRPAAAASSLQQAAAAAAGPAGAQLAGRNQQLGHAYAKPTSSQGTSPQPARSAQQQEQQDVERGVVRPAAKQGHVPAQPPRQGTPPQQQEQQGPPQPQPAQQQQQQQETQEHEEPSSPSGSATSAVLPLGPAHALHFAAAAVSVPVTPPPSSTGREEAGLTSPPSPTAAGPGPSAAVAVAAAVVRGPQKLWGAAAAAVEGAGLHKTGANGHRQPEGNASAALKQQQQDKNRNQGTQEPGKKPEGSGQHRTNIRIDRGTIKGLPAPKRRSPPATEAAAAAETAVAASASLPAGVGGTATSPFKRVRLEQPPVAVFGHVHSEDVATAGTHQKGYQQLQPQWRIGGAQRQRQEANDPAQPQLSGNAGKQQQQQQRREGQQEQAPVHGPAIVQRDNMNLVPGQGASQQEGSQQQQQQQEGEDPPAPEQKLLPPLPQLPLAQGRGQAQGPGPPAAQDDQEDEDEDVVVVCSRPAPPGAAAAAEPLYVDLLEDSSEEE